MHTLHLWNRSFPMILHHLGDTNAPLYLHGSILRYFNQLDHSLFESISKDVLSDLCELVLQKITPQSAYIRSLALETCSILLPYARKNSISLFIATTMKKLSEALSPSQSHSMRIRANFLFYEYLPHLYEYYEDDIWNTTILQIFCYLEDSLLRKHPEKLQLSTIRTLGQLGHFAPFEFLSFVVDYHPNSMVIRIFQLLLDQLGFSHHVKIQWNACVAIGLILKNSLIYYEQALPIIRKTLTCLGNLTWQSENLKIRIHAARALSSLTTLEHYGPSLITVQDSLQIAREALQIVPTTDRAAFNNKIQLEEELSKLNSLLRS